MPRLALRSLPKLPKYRKMSKKDIKIPDRRTLDDEKPYSKMEFPSCTHEVCYNETRDIVKSIGGKTDGRLGINTYLNRGLLKLCGRKLSWLLSLHLTN